MKNIKQNIINVINWGIIAVAAGCLAYSLIFLPYEKLDVFLLGLTLLALFLGAYSHIQLPRIKIHFSFVEIAIFYTLLEYGTEIAVLIGVIESAFTSIMLRRKGVNFKTKTIFQNFATTVLTTFVTGLVTTLVFPVSTSLKLYSDYTVLAEIIFLACIVHFTLNSVLVSFITSTKKDDKTIWQVFNENCFPTLIIYPVSGLITALMIIALERINGMLLFVTGFVALVGYLTYKRFINDIKDSSAKVEQAERSRAEQAELHVVELQHYIGELESKATALKESEKKLRYTAFHDALTDLPNRNKFLERLQFLIERSKYEPNLHFAVLFIDLNRFKAINDSLGHSIGNELIKYVANRLKGLIREDDLAARFGSDEFAIILNNISGMEEAEYFAQTIDSTISDPFTLKGRQVFTSPSIGIALNDSRYELAENLLRDADIAMYNAKASNIPYKFFDQNMHTQAVTRLQIETDLRYAIERKELLVYYQPIIDLNTIELIGFEALMRWQHPVRGLIPPFEFIPISETTGQIVPMTLWILRESCRQVVEWTQMFGLKRCPMISVNLSGKHFTQPNLVEQIKNITQETGINVSSLKLEITESAVMENAESAIRMLKQLRELGVQLSIDDFGTGYSSLSYLHSFPINALKVDRSFVCAMESGTENGEIVRTIIALAKALNLSVIAEGIESIHQLHQLRVLGCEYGQGYLFSRPVPKDEAVKLLMNTSQWKAILPHPQNRVVKHQNDFGLLEMDEPVTDTRDIIQ